MSKKEELNIQRQKIKDLLQEGLLQKEISSILNIPIRTVKRRISEIKSTDQ